MISVVYAYLDPSLSAALVAALSRSRSGSNAGVTRSDVRVTVFERNRTTSRHRVRHCVGIKYANRARQYSAVGVRRVCRVGGAEKRREPRDRVPDRCSRNDTVTPPSARQNGAIPPRATISATGSRARGASSPSRTCAQVRRSLRRQRATCSPCAMPDATQGTPRECGGARSR